MSKQYSNLKSIAGAGLPAQAHNVLSPGASSQSFGIEPRATERPVPLHWLTGKGARFSAVIVGSRFITCFFLSSCLRPIFFPLLLPIPLLFHIPHLIFRGPKEENQGKSNYLMICRSSSWFLGCPVWKKFSCCFCVREIIQYVRGGTFLIPLHASLVFSLDSGECSF